MVNNILKQGMEFKSYSEFSTFMGYPYTDSRVVQRNRVKHHCTFHKRKYTIIIDEVKDVTTLYNGNNLNYIYEIGDVVKISTGSTKIIDKFFKKMSTGKNVRYYTCQCCKDGYKYDISQYSLRKGVGCQVCLNHIIIKGINDINTTHPHIASMITNESDRYSFSGYSRKITEFQCPFCDNKKDLRISYVTERGRFSCNICGDNFSYPNKFVYNALKQVCEDIVCEKTFNWSDKKRYDLYSEANSLIIENHGLFHYDKRHEIYNQHYDYTVQNDEYKNKLATTNNICHYIVLDCRKSNCKWIKESIMNSQLPELLNFTENDIDWDICEKNASSSLLYKIYDIYKNQTQVITHIADIVGIGRETCGQYLKKALLLYE